VHNGRFYLHLNDTLDLLAGFDYNYGVSLDTLDDLDLQQIALAILQWQDEQSSIE
tara:strand:- start:1165 stop:1329 length:165 start_codon:yes stop_codon:yes gene_type:complete